MNKKIINRRTFACASFLFFLGILYGCGNGEKESIATPLEQGRYATIVIDSCEYLQYYVDLKYGNPYTTSEYKAKMLTHKGNCKFCLSRFK